jgi:peptidoglycan/xylan/chitin deacetylase (PgdA/CDA1 family)
MYHAVTPGKDVPSWPWAVSMQQFCAQLDFLAAEGYATPTMGELVAAPEKWKGRVAVLTFDDGYVDNLAACEALQKHSMRASWFVVTGSIGQSPKWPNEGRPSGRLLNALELRDMQACGMEIGSHAVNHMRLTKTDDTRLAQELADSKATLEDLLGNPVGSFAYPYGAWDARCAAAVKHAGYSAACTTRTGWALRDNDPFQIRRLTIFNVDRLSVFARKLCFASNNVSWPEMVRQKLRRHLAQ